MSLEDILNVSTTISASTVSQAGFSVPLIFAHHTAFADLVREYSVSSFKTAMVADGIPSTHAAYQCALAISKQSPAPTTFKLGKRSTADTQIVRLVPTAQNSTAYKFTAKSPAGIEYPITFTSDASATIAEVATGLATVFNTATGTTNASGVSGTWVELTATADQIWGYYDLSANLALLDTSTSSGTLDDDLTAIQQVDNDWYGLAPATSSPAAIKECADWVEATNAAGPGRKIMIASTHDMSVFDSGVTTSVFQYVDTANYVRSHIAYQSDATAFYGPAWLAMGITYEPGAFDWMFKTIVGARGDKLSAAREARLENFGGSYYQDIYRGKTITGSAGGPGTFLDLIQLSDWALVRAIENILAGLTSAPKVPHTDQGAGNMIWGAYKAVIDRGVANEAIDGDPSTWSITVPLRKDLSPSDRSAYRWSGTSFAFTPTGALHSVGPVTITLNVQ